MSEIEPQDVLSERRNRHKILKKDLNRAFSQAKNYPVDVVGDPLFSYKSYGVADELAWLDMQQRNWPDNRKRLGSTNIVLVSNPHEYPELLRLGYRKVFNLDSPEWVKDQLEHELAHWRLVVESGISAALGLSFLYQFGAPALQPIVSIRPGSRVPLTLMSEMTISPKKPSLGDNSFHEALELEIEKGSVHGFVLGNLTSIE